MVAVLPLMNAPAAVVIAGGGIIGNSIAYFLAKDHNVKCTIVDPVGIAPGASAKAGGFLAKEWRDGTVLAPLQRLGFELHQELASDLEGDNETESDKSRIDYRRLTCAAVGIDESQVVSKPTSRKHQGVEWVDRGVTGTAVMGDESNIAQVHPRKLCEAMWDYSSQSVASTLQAGRVIKALFEESGDDGGKSAIRGVELEDGTTIEASHLIVACGPWSNEARSWFADASTSTNRDAFPPVSSVKCHSMLVQHPLNRVLNQAVFFESAGSLGAADVEVYPRPDGDCYVNGFQAEEGIVDEAPGQEAIEPHAVESLKGAMVQTTSELGGVEPHTVQACYWPESMDGLPMMGAIPNIPGAFVATGHSVWGILQGPATGKAMAELIVRGESTCIDLTPFRVERFFKDNDMF